jgi:hypothetical protein
MERELLIEHPEGVTIAHTRGDYKGPQRLELQGLTNLKYKTTEFQNNRGFKTDATTYWCVTVAR